MSTDVDDAVPLIVTDAGDTPHVTGLTALAGAVVTAQESPTVPTYPLAGVTVRVDVFPVVAPAATVMGALLESVMLGVPSTVTVLVVVAVNFPVASSLPVMVTM